MPVARKKLDAPVPEHVELPVGQIRKDKEIYHTSTIDTAIIPPAGVVAYLEGSPWSVTYFSQVVNRDNEIREVDVGNSAALQQYRKIIDLEIRVQSDLSTTYDEDLGRNTVSGVSIATSIVPNKYDYFVTAAGNKGLGLFIVNGVTRKNYQDTSVYEIGYSLVGYIDNDTTRDQYQALEGRTVRIYYFDKNRLVEGLNPLLTTEEHGLSIRLRESYVSIFRQYIDLFFSPTDRLLYFPDQDTTIYDARFGDFIRQVINHDLIPQAQHFNRVSIDRDPWLSKTCVLDAIIGKSIDFLAMPNRKVGIIPRAYFGANSQFKASNCWNVQDYVYPDLDLESPFYSAIQMKSHPSYHGNDWFNLYEIPVLNDTYENSPENLVQYADNAIKLIKSIHRDNYYIFSKEFYIQGDDLSLVEIIVRDYIMGRPMNLQHLDHVLSKWTQWPDQEKFYYVPILLVIVQDTVRGFC